jgi:hypothetical protein
MDENINARELRLGNWVEDEDESHLRFQVTHIEQGIGFVSDMIFINGRAEHGIIPIPLTHEILEKAGFEMYQETKYVHRYTHLANSKIGYEYEKGEPGRATYFNHYINCKYLHQLQNLYYCLTGKELEITL